MDANYYAKLLERAQMRGLQDFSMSPDDRAQLAAGQAHLAQEIASSVESGDFIRAVGLAGRELGPSLLFTWLREGRLTDVTQLHKLLADVWTSAEFPQEHLGRQEWVNLFRRAGFVTDRPGVAPPATASLTGYRAATWGRRRGMAWTTSLKVARRFAEPNFHNGLKALPVFRVSLPPDAVLALLFDDGGRQEEEVVVDPFALPSITRRDIIEPAWKSGLCAGKPGISAG